MAYDEFRMIPIAHASEATDKAHLFVAKINAVILFPLIALMTTVAIIVFMWGGFQYVRGANNPAAREKGQKHLLWGIIGLLVMLSAYTILSIAAATFGLDPDTHSETETAAFGSRSQSAPATSVRPPNTTTLPETANDNTSGNETAFDSNVVLDTLNLALTNIGEPERTEIVYVVDPDEYTAGHGSRCDQVGGHNQTLVLTAPVVATVQVCAK